ncbi:MAG: hypothetical protein HY791_21040 [Deltaproteobacteria bacterium]|nr:hypothetical protein [Deltaproteobacteria bacterium]
MSKPLSMAIVALGLALGVAPSLFGVDGPVYTEDVHFQVRISETTYRGTANEVFLMLDRAGGRNRLQVARLMSNVGGDTFEATVPLEEGEYIYVFVANPRQYVDLTDENLNPDDVPDSSFFNDPHPRFTGYGGQYGKDNVYRVTNPKRPKLSAVSPTSGSVVAALPVTLRVRAELGSDGSAIDAASVSVAYEREDPYGSFPGALVPPAADLVNVAGATYASGEVSVSLASLPEGLRRIHVDLKSQSGFEAKTLVVPLFVNAQNQAPRAKAGPTRFGYVGQFIELDGGWSEDPDMLGFSNFTWRKVSGPGNVELRGVRQEPRNNDGAQRRPDGVPVVDADGNFVADALPAPGPIPQARFDAAGEYELGLIATDRGGLASPESTTKVIVSARYQPAWRLRLHVGERNGRVLISAGASDVPNGVPVRFYADSLTPFSLNAVNDREAEADRPAAGAYFVHAIAGDPGNETSYPAEAIVIVRPDGTLEGRDTARSSKVWRDDTNLYLLFVREFFDKNGDGEGDLEGAIEKLPWIKSLGANAIWVMPVEPSGTTHGYAMDAFFSVHDDYGSAETLRRFIDRAHELGIRVVLDLVFNHTSVKHHWWPGAEDPSGFSRDRYVFRPDGSFQYAFDFVSLPDLDYGNPIVRATGQARAKFWMDLGFDGFRCDIAGFTPRLMWRGVRREVLSHTIEGFMLAEIIPPLEDYLEGQFDAFYDPWTYWETRDAFAGNKDFSSLDTAIKAAERYVQNAPRGIIRDKVDPADVIRVRYLDNQDEDRFLLLAGGSQDRQRVASAVLLTMPGVPLITYGDESALVEGRGRMTFTRNPEMVAHYKKYLRIRNGNPGLRGQSSDNFPGAGNRYIRISSDDDMNGRQVFSYLRHGNNQSFVVLANRGPAPVTGTRAQFYVGREILDRIPEDPIVMTNHANPRDILTVGKQQLQSGHIAPVGGYEVKVYQLGTVEIPDGDADGILDSFDGCVGVPNGSDQDDDFDGVPNACDHCASSTTREDVGMDGCARASGAPRPTYTLDGTLDDASYQVASGDGLTLYASFNGRVLYLATNGARPGRDHVILLDEDDNPLEPAAFGKAGRVAARWSFIDEGRTDRTEWAGPWVGTKAASNTPVADGVAETTINLVERFGASFPQHVRVAVVAYDGADLAGQAPSATTPGSDVSTDELLELPLVAPEITAAGPVEPTRDAGLPATRDGGGSPTDDLDGDDVADGVDNCLGVQNADQADHDDDGRGDACDDCPLTSPGSPIDGRGCEKDPGTTGPSFDEDETDKQREGCGCASTPRDRSTTLAPMLLLAALFFRRRFLAVASALVVSACGAFGEPSAPVEGERLISGRLVPPSPADVGPTVIALEPLALALDARADPKIALVRRGEAFNPAANGGEPVAFRLSLPSDRTFLLLFQTPGQGQSGLGRLVARFRFPADGSGASTDLLSAPLPGVPAPDLELGTVKITTSRAVEGDREAFVLFDGTTDRNPLGQNDVDGDGAPDLEDADDDADFIPDEGDLDSDGDGIPNADQGFDVLLAMDQDGDHVPDALDN